VGICQ